MKKISYVLLAVGIYWFIFIRSTSVILGSGVFAPDTPKQFDISSPQSFQYRDYKITELAEFDIKAKVLSRKNYNSGRESELSPVDLALGWGRMSDESVIENLKISQSRRWYRWQTKVLPIPANEISTHSANMHLIAKDSYVESQFDAIREGDIVELTGSLIRVDSEDGWQWVSSLTRNDSGAGACELIWVEDVSIVSDAQVSFN